MLVLAEEATAVAAVLVEVRSAAEGGGSWSLLAVAAQLERVEAELEPHAAAALLLEPHDQVGHAHLQAAQQIVRQHLVL